MTTDLKTFIGEQLKVTAKMYLQDLQAMSHEQLSFSPSDVARTAYDFTYEVILVNRRVAARLRGEDPGAWPGGEGFLKAPAEFCNKEQAMKELEDSTVAALAAWETTPQDRLTEKIVVPQGETSPLELMSILLSHLPYHDGQLNYLQTIHGDGEVHWEFD